MAAFRKFKPELIATVDQLLDQYCDRARNAYKLASRYERLRRRGMLTTREVAAKFGTQKRPCTTGAARG